MSAVIFTDTSLLVNFEIIGELELLEELIARSAQWTLEIRREVSSMSTTYQGLQTVAGFMPEALTPTTAEMLLTRKIRDTMTGPGEPRTKNIGEAETMAIVESRYVLAGVLVATEDRGVVTYVNQLNARRRADGLSPDVRVLTTRKLLEVGVRKGVLTDRTRQRHLETLRWRSRGLLAEDS